VSGAALALDVGSVRIGVAICEDPRLPAMPLTTIVRRNLAADLKAVIQLAAERDARTIVVGYPIRLDGSRGPAAQKMDVFIEQLRQGFSGIVARQDERLTTAAAAKKLREIDASGSKRRRHLDEVAAVEILNSYLAAKART
jgi:putative Holliday junction resolvase